MHRRPRLKPRRNTRLNSGSLQASAKVAHQFVLTAGFGHGRSMGLGPAERDRATRNPSTFRLCWSPVLRSIRRLCRVGVDLSRSTTDLPSARYQG
jgi:hypothetical protein